jgi:hypothetical protein
VGADALHFYRGRGRQRMGQFAADVLLTILFEKDNKWLNLLIKN